MPVHKHVPPYSSAGGGPSLNGETMQVPPLPASGMLSGRWPLSLAATVTLPRRRFACKAKKKHTARPPLARELCFSARGAGAGSLSIHTSAAGPGESARDVAQAAHRQQEPARDSLHVDMRHAVLTPRSQSASSQPRRDCQPQPVGCDCPCRCISASSSWLRERRRIVKNIIYCLGFRF